MVCVLVCVCVIMQDLHGVSMMLKRERESFSSIVLLLEKLEGSIRAR